MNQILMFAAIEVVQTPPTTVEVICKTIIICVAIIVFGWVLVKLLFKLLSVSKAESNLVQIS